MITLNVNGVRGEVQASDDAPLLYVLRNDLQLIGPQFGCGLAQCGACAVLVDGKEARSCVTTVSEVAGKDITTLEGLAARKTKPTLRFCSGRYALAIPEAARFPRKFE